MKKIITLLVTLVLSICCVFGMTACGKEKIGVQAGTTGAFYVNGDADWGFSGLKNYSSLEFDTPTLAIQALKNNQVKYVICDKDPANTVKNNVGGVKIIPYELNTEEYGFGVDKGQTNLLASINGALADLTSDGTIASIFNNYNNLYDETKNPTGYQPVGVAGGSVDLNNKDSQLVVATHTGFQPFEYMNGNKFVGVDIEICKAIADKLDMELVILDMDFSATITSVGNNGVDMAAAAITIKEVRKQSVNFTNPYYSEAAQVLVVLEDDTTFDSCTSKEDVLAILNK